LRGACIDARPVWPGRRACHLEERQAKPQALYGRVWMSEFSGEIEPGKDLTTNVVATV
jgi:hypothetical protein